MMLNRINKWFNLGNEQGDWEPFFEGIKVENATKKTPLHEDRQAALVQWNAAHTLINSLEKRLSLSQKALSETQDKLIERTEI